MATDRHLVAVPEPDDGGASPTAPSGGVSTGEALAPFLRHLANRRGQTFNAKRAAASSALAHFQAQGWIPDAAAVLAGLDREYQPKPTDNRVRTREQIDRLITDKRQPLEDRTLWSMLYSTAARAEEVLGLDVTDLTGPTAGPARSARAARPTTCSTTSAPPA